MRAILLLCAGLTSCGITGCGSVFNLGFTPCGVNHDAGHIYGGVRNDVGLICGPHAGVAIRAFGAVDLPLSFAVDTVTLPLVVPVAVRRLQEHSHPTPEQDPAKETARNDAGMPASAGSQGESESVTKTSALVPQP
jgi:uncharacterized protein YceK